MLDDGTSSNETRLGAVKDVSFAIETLSLDDDMLVIAGDNVLDFSLTRFIAYAKEKKTSAIMRYYEKDEKWEQLLRHAEQVRKLADKYDIGLADSFEAFNRQVSVEDDLSKYLSHVNHPTQAGHQLVADELAKYFIAR